jgi:alpha-tubulin suppressor-like RCC1 family protein
MRGLVHRVGGLGLVALLLPACGIGGGGGTLTPTIAPGSPTDVSPKAGNRSVTISWTLSAAGASYTVLRSLVSGGPFFPVSVPGQFRSPTVYVDPGLTNGTTYYYQVLAVNAFGTSAPSAVASATPGFHPASLAGGGGDLLAQLPDGSVWEWGRMHGLGTSDFPVQVAGLDDITAVSTNLNHALALGSDGRVWAWGLNPNGQLGTTVPGGSSATPVLVDGIADAIAVSAGEQHSLALKHDGTVLAWGSNQQGQFGLVVTTPANSATPQLVPGLSNIVAIHAGTAHSLALRSDGLVFGWGDNTYGQLGNPPAGGPLVGPTLVGNLTGVVAISAGTNHSMALRSDGTVWCWGDNSRGQCGIGATPTSVAVPTQTPTLSGITGIAGGLVSSLVVKNDGTVWSFGDNTMGQIGNGTTGGTVTSPVKVSTITDAVGVAASGYNGVALSADGTLRSWGDNVNGGLGNGTGQVTQIPIELPNFTGAAAVAAGQDFSMALKSTGTVWGWGSDANAQLGNGAASGTPVVTPVQAGTISTATAIATGVMHGVALLSNGTLVAWGGNGSGQIGDGTSGNTRVSPVAVGVVSNIVGIASGSLHSFAIRNDATYDHALYGWGYNNQGQVGNGATGTLVTSPTLISGMTTVVSVAAGDRHTIAAKSDGSVWVWGYNDFGQLGQGTIGFTSMASPTPVTGFSDAVAVGSGLFHCLVLRADETVWAWGKGDLGELGNGGTSTSGTPAPVTGLAGVTAVTGGYDHSYALKSDGTIWAWGSNGSGQLGNPVATLSSVPVPVQQLSGVTSIRSGNYHGVARLGNGTVWCWGFNSSSQLGVGYVSQSTVPVVITQ